MGLTSPFRKVDERRLDRYFQTRLASSRYVPPDEAQNPEWDIFRSSLLSSWDHLGGTTPERRADGARFRLAAGFVDLISPGAFAAVEAGTHLIGVHTGLVAAMQEIALFFYSQASFFPEVGKPERERSPMLPATSSLSFTILDSTRVAAPNRIREFGEAITPRDGTRYMHAQYMTLLLLRFAWYHEFYHCVNGHVGLLRDRAIANALCEVPDAVHSLPDDSASTGEVALRLQEITHCLEMDADRSALWVSAQIQLVGHENIRGLERLDLRLRMKMVLFSAFLITHFFAENNRRAAKPSPFHPSGELRLHNLVRTVASNLLDAYGETRALFQEVLEEFATLEEQVPSLMRTSDLLRDFRSEEFQDRLELAEANLRSIRTALHPFAYVAA